MSTMPFIGTDFPKDLYNDATLKYMGFDLKGMITVKWRDGWRRFKRRTESDLQETKLSHDQKDIYSFVSRENLAQKIPDCRNIIDGLDTVKISRVAENLEFLREEGLLLGMKITEIIEHYGLEYLGYRNGRFNLPKELEWLETYLNEVGGRYGDSMSWDNKLQYTRDGKSTRYSYHYIALGEMAGRPCYEPLGLLLIIR